MEAFCDQHAPGLFGQLYKCIVNDDKEKPSKKRLEIQKARVVSMLHNLSLFCNQVQVTYICALCSYRKLYKTLKLLSLFPVLIYFPLIKDQPQKTVTLKELAKHFFVCLCVLEELSHPEGKWFKSENERSQLQLLDVWNGS